MDKRIYLIIFIILIILIIATYSNIFVLLSVLLLFGCTIPLLIYLEYSRDPKITYKAEYEHDLPTNDPPAIVNAICGPGFSKKIGEPDMDGFEATIMDLINRKYLVFNNKVEDKSLYLKIDPKKDKSLLKTFELDVLNFFIHFTGNNNEIMDIDKHFMTKDELKKEEEKHEDLNLISMSRISSDLSTPETASFFRNTYNKWLTDVKNKISTDDILNKIFDSRGANYLKMFSIFGVITAILVFLFALVNLPHSNILVFSTVIFGVVSVISFILPQRLEGHWTTYGEEYNAKWHNFKKYVEDFSLIKDYPPESIKIWNKYLVYATALGVAEKVRKSMELYLPTDQLELSEIYMFHYMGGYNILSTSLAGGFTTATIESAGGDFVGAKDLGRDRFRRFGGPL